MLAYSKIVVAQPNLYSPGARVLLNTDISSRIVFGYVYYFPVEAEDTDDKEEEAKDISHVVFGQVADAVDWWPVRKPVDVLAD